MPPCFFATTTGSAGVVEPRKIRDAPACLGQHNASGVTRQLFSQWFWHPPLCSTRSAVFLRVGELGCCLAAADDLASASWTQAC
jgi:hypothetical protein